MKKSNRKGFTIVELVIVIAVIAILAAVLIPTFASIIRKANISNDTMLAKNLNTALTAEEAISGEPKDFDEVISILKANGFVIANLNPSADECYFVWESSTNQILLVDGKDDYKVIFSAKEGYAEIGETWYFAIGNPEEQKAVEEDLAGKEVIFRTTISNAKDLTAALAENSVIYLDESVVITEKNLIDVSKSGADVTLNLGDAKLTSDGTLDKKIPVKVATGAKLTLNGGVIGAVGSGVDIDGKAYSSPISTLDGSTITINDTQFNTSASPLQFAGKATLNNVTTSGYFYARRDGDVELNNCKADVIGEVALWVTNTKDEITSGSKYVGSATLTVKSGSYKSTVTGDFGLASVHAGTMKIEGGEYTSAEGQMFAVVHAGGKIIVSGGTFNNVKFSQLDETAIAKLCVGGAAKHNVVKNADGSFTITKK